MVIECAPASTKPSSNPKGVSKMDLQIASTSSHSGIMPASTTNGSTSVLPRFLGMAAVSLPGSPASGAPFLGRSDKFGKHVRSIFPETGFMTNFSTRKILVGIDDGG